MARLLCFLDRLAASTPPLRCVNTAGRKQEGIAKCDREVIFESADHAKATPCGAAFLFKRNCALSVGSGRDAFFLQNREVDSAALVAHCDYLMESVESLYIPVVISTITSPTLWFGVAVFVVMRVPTGSFSPTTWPA